MATSKMISALRRHKKVDADKQGRLPKDYVEWLESYVTDDLFYNCRYCKNYLTCSPKFEGLIPCDKYFFKED